MSALVRTFSCPLEDEERLPDTIPSASDSIESLADTVRERNITWFQIKPEELIELMEKIERSSNSTDTSTESEKVLDYFRKECDKCKSHLPDSDCRGEETPGHFLSDYIQGIICDLMLYYKNCNDEHVVDELKNILKDLYAVMYGYFMKDYLLSFSDEVVQMSAKRVAVMVSSCELDINDAPRFVDMDLDIMRKMCRP